MEPNATDSTHTCAIIDSDTWRSRLRDYIDVNEALITPAVAEDPNDRNASVSDFAAAVDELRLFLDERRAYLRTELGCP